MQRLFSTFPNSWPGAGLLVIRAGVGSFLLLGVNDCPSLFFSKCTLNASHLLLELAGTFVIAGLCTPFAAAFATLVVGIAMASGPLRLELVLCLSTLVGLALVGPGAWSFDALLFGRRVLVLNRDPNEPK